MFLVTCSAAAYFNDKETTRKKEFYLHFLNMKHK